MRKRMLIVDDEPTLRWALSRYFTLQGYDVVSAENLREALEAVAAVPVQVVLTDLLFGRGQREDGLELVARLRDLMPHARFILLTGYSNAQTRQRAHDARVDLFLVKPQPLTALARYIDAFATRARPEPT
ncbi:response regulator [Pyxidicoccus parkwayensis]|uniref:Response regulator n=1 Tax=Pyxidicoccus parkwayensis TaxID=2813578 RepID=A0ABX7NTF2_9BACT|nr:response regulator [Pyxidicoccus parkwaysis]QSQ22152.1 response regulator [Pyxidicoccus parkwaysis]